MKSGRRDPRRGTNAPDGNPRERGGTGLQTGRRSKLDRTVLPGLTRLATGNAVATREATRDFLLRPVCGPHKKVPRPRGAGRAGRRCRYSAGVRQRRRVGVPAGARGSAGARVQACGHAPGSSKAASSRASCLQTLSGPSSGRTGQSESGTARAARGVQRDPASSRRRAAGVVDEGRRPSRRARVAGAPGRPATNPVTGLEARVKRDSAQARSQTWPTGWKR